MTNDKEPAMSLRQNKILLICMELLCGAVVLVISLFWLSLALRPTFSIEDFFWGMCLLPVMFFCLFNNIFNPMIFRDSPKAKGDLEHLLFLKPIWKQKATTRVSLGKFIRVGQPKQRAPESGTTLDRLIAAKKQGDWLPTDECDNH